MSRFQWASAVAGMQPASNSMPGSGIRDPLACRTGALVARLSPPNTTRAVRQGNSSPSKTEFPQVWPRPIPVSPLPPISLTSERRWPFHSSFSAGHLHSLPTQVIKPVALMRARSLLLRQGTAILGHKGTGAGSPLIRYVAIRCVAEPLALLSIG
jgi:DNA helicase HerA-like ATPase